jgi:hypothetical protein
VTTADDLLALVGLPVDDPRVQESLARFANGVQPELDPDDEESYVDWVPVRETGLEFGFEDEAYVRALREELRRPGPLILTQLYFYGDTPVTRPFPYPLPYGLSLTDDRERVREKLSRLQARLRSYVRDVWQLPLFDLTVAYSDDHRSVQSLFFHVPYDPWPPLPDLPAPGLTVSSFVNAFGLRWSSRRLRETFASLHYDRHLDDVRRERVADLRLTYGIELYFTEAGRFGATEPAFAHSLAFASVTFFAARELDAREWTGALPFGLRFEDTQSIMMEKIAAIPAERYDEDFSGYAVWHFDDFSLSVNYSNLDNRLLRVSVMTPGYW